MQCCVPNCASNELKPNKSENSGITYHELPKDSQTRSQWIQGLQLGDWRPNAESYICSLHLSNEDIMQAELHALKTDVDDVPVMFEMNIEENTESITIGNVCRICLSTDRKVYNIGENDIAQQYEFLTARKDCLGDGLPQHICWECKARLASFARLRSVALRSLELLQVFYENINNDEKTQDLKLNIGRNANHSTSTLILSNIEIVDYPPTSELMVVFDVKPDNTVSSNLENRNDNDKTTKVPKVLSKGRKSTKLKNENVNLDKRTKVLNKVKKNTMVKNENGNSDLNDVNDNLGNRKKASKALSKGRKSTLMKNENDNPDINYFEDIKDEPASEKSDDVNYNSGLEDIIYDSDSSKSENQDINRTVDSHLAKINGLFDDEKLSYIKRGINIDCSRIKNGKNTIDDTSKCDKELEETFSVKHLSKDEQMKEFLQRKESDNYKNAGFKCDICYRGFVHEKAFNLHQMKHTDVHGPSKCTLCGVHFKNSAHMRKHLKDSHQNRYSCNACEYITGTLHNAKLHVKFHKGTTYKCSQCDKTFQKKSSMLSHIRIHHPSDVVCRLCGYSFLNERGLHLHTVRTHKLDKQVPEDGPRCVECDIQFSTDTALTTHYQESNKHKDVFPVNESRKRRASGDTKPLFTKPPRKRNKGPVNCELCAIELPTFMKYRWHFKKYHPDKVRTLYSGKLMCEMCGLVCTRPALLEAHKDTHSEIKNYSCEECGKQFKTKQSLYSHKEKHLAKKFSCDICLKTFTYFTNMQRHKIIHENRKFDCNICGKSFNHPQNRQNHITYVHLKKPLPVRRNRK